MVKKNKKPSSTNKAESRAVSDRRGGKKSYKGEENRGKRIGRRGEDALASKVHVISLSIVLTLLALHGLVIALHYFKPELFQ